MDTIISAKLFAGKRFRFGQIGRPPYGHNFKFDENNKITGYSNPNEHSWEIDTGAILVKSNDGRITTIFDKMELEFGLIKLYGRSPGTVIYHHELNENSAAHLPFASVSKEHLSFPQPTNKVAVLVRSHKCDAKFDDLMQKLRAASRSFDIYPIVDETNGRQTTTENNILWHSISACRELGLTQVHQILFIVCGDFPYYFALREIPKYEYYIMIEDDVDFMEGQDSFLETLSQRLIDQPGLDFIGLNFRKMASTSGWYPACVKVFPDRDCYNAYFPFSVLSKRAASYLFSQRQIEASRSPESHDVIHCEAFVVSALTAGGFNCAELNDIISNSYAFPTMAMQVPSDGVGRPMGYDFKDDPHTDVAMVHPIYTHEEYIDRVYRKFILGRSGDWNGLEKELRSKHAASVPEELKLNLINKRAL